MFYIVINPTARSGRGMKIWQDLRKELDDKQVEYRYYYTAKNHSAGTIAKCILNKDKGLINLILLGGDGTVNETVNGIAAAGDKCFERLKLCYIPTGSARDLARALELPDDPHECLRRILAADGQKIQGLDGNVSAAEERRTDLGLLTYNDAQKAELNGHRRFFIVSAGIGFDAAVCAEVAHSRLKKFFNKLGLGGLVYGFICVKGLLTAPRADCNIYMDGERMYPARDCILTAVMNHKYQGGGVMFAPEADSTDGMLDLCFTDRMSRHRVMMTFPKAYSGAHVGTKGICMDRASSLRITSSQMLYVHTDGEVATKAMDISIKCLPGKLRLMV
ncbi:MAG: hypothetical protein IJM34_04040 [Lachnospiraceae bacterium]|nr:hypothetical protein [Lachnospiraceae bacterium]